jgi:tellurite resistance protein TerC
MSDGPGGGRDQRNDTDPVGQPAARPREPWPLDRIVRMGLRQVWRLIILVVGGTVLLLGLVMVVTPGPAFVVVPIGLAILAVEFAWARRLLHRVRERAARIRQDYWGRRE